MWIWGLPGHNTKRPPKKVFRLSFILKGGGKEGRNEIIREYLGLISTHLKFQLNWSTSHGAGDPRKPKWKTPDVTCPKKDNIIAQFIRLILSYSVSTVVVHSRKIWIPLTLEVWTLFWEVAGMPVTDMSQSVGLPLTKAVSSFESF